LQCDWEETGPSKALNIMAESTLRKLGRLSPYFRVIGRHRSHTETTRTTSVPSALNPLLRIVLTLKLVLFRSFDKLVSFSIGARTHRIPTEIMFQSLVSNRALVLV
jgi:hypothetical protein